MNNRSAIKSLTLSNDGDGAKAQQKGGQSAGVTALLAPTLGYSYGLFINCYGDRQQHHVVKTKTTFPSTVLYQKRVHPEKMCDCGGEGILTWRSLSPISSPSSKRARITCITSTYNSVLPLIDCNRAFCWRQYTTSGYGSVSMIRYFSRIRFQPLVKRCQVSIVMYNPDPLSNKWNNVHVQLLYNVLVECPNSDTNFMKHNFF